MPAACPILDIGGARQTVAAARRPGTTGVPHTDDAGTRARIAAHVAR